MGVAVDTPAGDFVILTPQKVRGAGGTFPDTAHPCLIMQAL
jgi:hypothetical protein